MLLSNCKKIDLHGETRESARFLVQEFIHDCVLLEEEIGVIIHGIGTGALKQEVHQTLAQNKQVENFYVDFENPGQTIVKIRTKC